MNYKIIKIRNGLWHLLCDDVYHTEHSTRDGAERMLAMLKKHTLVSGSPLNKAKIPQRRISAAASGTGTQQENNTRYGVLPNLIIKCVHCKGTGRAWVGGGYTYGVEIACIECNGAGQVDEEGVPVRL